MLGIAFRLLMTLDREGRESFAHVKDPISDNTMDTCWWTY